MMRPTLSIAAFCVVVVSGCATSESDPVTAPLPEDRPLVLSRPYIAPTPTIEIRPVAERPELGRTIAVTITVPSGGHQLTLDRGIVDQREAHMYLTIEQPARDEVVTMALDTLRTEFRTDRQFEVVNVYIRSHRRDQTPPTGYHFAGDERID